MSILLLRHRCRSHNTPNSRDQPRASTELNEKAEDEKGTRREREALLRPARSSSSKKSPRPAVAGPNTVGEEDVAFLRGRACQKEVVAPSEDM